jgi:hypothetical protein
LNDALITLQCLFNVIHVIEKKKSNDLINQKVSENKILKEDQKEKFVSGFFRKENNTIHSDLLNSWGCLLLRDISFLSLPLRLRKLLVPVITYCILHICEFDPDHIRRVSACFAGNEHIGESQKKEEEILEFEYFPYFHPSSYILKFIVFANKDFCKILLIPIITALIGFLLFFFFFFLFFFYLLFSFIYF